MTESPRYHRGALPGRPRRTQKDFGDDVRACPRCGTRLSRWNPGPRCNSCADTVDPPQTPRIRGRVSGDDE